jgi:hypothetical protein
MQFILLLLPFTIKWPSTLCKDLFSRLKIIKTSAFILAIIVSSVLHAQNNIDTIHAGDGKLDLKYLPTGTQRYLVYIKTKDGDKKGIWLWERTTAREIRENKNTIVIRQQWKTSDTGYNYRKLESVVDPKTFTPIYHHTENPKTGSETFNLLSSEFLTVDPTANDARKNKNLDPMGTTFNWELDLETFPLLPLKEGKTFVINFYHPGGKTQPAWYNYTVTGTEKIATVNGEKVDCYKLYIDYGSNRGNSTWWLSKKTHEVLKMEEHFGTITRYKIKLAALE